LGDRWQGDRRARIRAARDRRGVRRHLRSRLVRRL